MAGWYNNPWCKYDSYQGMPSEPALSGVEGHTVKYCVMVAPSAAEFAILSFATA